MSNSSAHSSFGTSNDSFSSVQSVILPPVGPFGQKKRTFEYIGVTLVVDKLKLAEWMNGIGKLFGSAELRDNVTNLHMQLVPVIDTLKKVSHLSSEKTKKEIMTLIEEYKTLVVVCENMLDRMEKSADFHSTDMLNDPVLEKQE